MDPSKISQIKHLYEIEHLTIRQIAEDLRMCTKTVSRIIKGEERPRRLRKPTLISPYRGLIEEWYARRPSLKATQIYERLKGYGYPGGYTMITDYTKAFRKKRHPVYHEIEFLPGACAQVDWMEATLPFGRVHGFVFVLAWSRYLFVRFYPRETLEFFLAGHSEAYGEIKGAARENWYDNLKSVVTTRKPLAFNAQFADYMRHMKVAIHACNPGKGNEKGRVERAIRDIRNMVETRDFTDIHDLNTRIDHWRKEWNLRIHRITRKTPASMLEEEPLLPLPAIPYRPYRVVRVLVGKTAFVEFETNRYSVPTDYGGQAASLLAYPDHLEIVIGERTIAHHSRSFKKHQKIEHPSHREKLLTRTPHGKYERIYHLMRRMGNEVDLFLTMAESEGEDRLKCAHGLFHLLLDSSKTILLSAVREACGQRIYRLRYIASLLGPRDVDPATIYPQNASLLGISYTKRELADYDDLT